jgi:hypothetical protein
MEGIVGTPIYSQKHRLKKMTWGLQLASEMEGAVLVRTELSTYEF